jgi:DNA-binding NarL/FixJ family response regulator
LEGLSPRGRLILEGAAVAGDPFDPELAAAAADVPEAIALDGIDELLRLDVVKATSVPRRFRFRHPLVRRAVVESTSGAWRLGAHQRCAETLAATGASASTRAHHVEFSAHTGDLDAVATLKTAGQEVIHLAPSSSARWFGAALRLMPQDGPAQERVDLHLAGARALTAAGHLKESHSTLLEALSFADACSTTTRAMLTRACATVESNLGLHEQARQRLVKTIDTLPPGLPEAVALKVDLAMNGFWRADFKAMQESAKVAADAARQLGDRPLTAAAASVLALADSMMGAAEDAERAHSEANDLVSSLSDEELARELDAAAWLAGAELYLDRYTEADLHAARALAVGRAFGQGELFLVVVQILGRVWFVRGKLAEATELLDAGIEAARLLRNDQALVWNLFNRSVVALSAGDLELALATAQESYDLSRELDQGFHTAWAGVRLAGALLETGQPDRAVELLLESAGGEEMVLIPGSWRGYCLDLLTRAWLACNRPIEAQRAAASAQAWASTVELPLAEAWADRATAAIRLHAGEAGEAAAAALASTNTAEAAGAPIEAALSRTLAGQALAKDGQNERAVAELQRAAADLDARGAIRYRERAERELRRLGHRIHRRTRPGAPGGSGIDSLTERELEVARLIVDRKTNAEIAEDLFISLKTVETHLRNIFHKMNVSSRVELARRVKRAEDTAPFMS